MPGYNGTGPTGAGPMTGRGRGLCNTDPDYGRPVPDMPYGFGRGMGMGRGARFGCGYGLGQKFRPGAGRMQTGRRLFRGSGGTTVSSSDELSQLRADAASTRGVLDDISKRIAELEKKNS